MCCACSKSLIPPESTYERNISDNLSVPGIRNLIRRFSPRLMGNTTGAGGTEGATGLSGRTAISSSNQKGVEVYIRQRDSEDRTFIPLESLSSIPQHLPQQSNTDISIDVSTKDLISPANGPVSPISNRDRSSRNFSRPKSHGWGGEV